MKMKLRVAIKDNGGPTWFAKRIGLNVRTVQNVMAGKSTKIHIKRLFAWELTGSPEFEELFEDDDNELWKD